MSTIPQVSAGSAQATMPAMPVTTKPVEKPVIDESKLNDDTFTKSDSSKEVESWQKKTQSYDKRTAMKAIKDAQAANESALRNMLTKSVAKQGEAFNVSMLGLKFNVGQEDIDKAKKMIEGDGFYSVNSVADRTMAMAKALSGGDSSKAPELRRAIESSYKEAERIWGDELPQICYDTKAEIMSRFDEWEKTGSIK